jgi:O-antigen/teichoic acid export membrane protein
MGRLLGGGRYWAVVDQGISSLTNLLVAIFAAHNLDLAGFGWFAVISGVYWLSVGSIRAAVNEPLLVLTELASGRQNQRGQRQTALTAFGLGLVLAIIIATAAIMLPVDRAAFLALAAIVPGMILQDSLRYSAFASRRYKLAFYSDVTALASIVSLYGMLAVSGLNPTLPLVVVIWGGSALLGCWVAVPLDLWRWSSKAAASWYHETKDLSGKTLAEFAIGSGIAQTAILLVPIVSSLDVAAAVRAAQVVVAPLNVLVTAVGILQIPRISRSFAAIGHNRAVRVAAGCAVVISVVGVSYILVVAVMPSAAGQLLLSGAWDEAAAIAPIIALHATLIAASQSAVYLLRAEGRSGRLVIARLCLAPVVLLAVSVGAYSFGASGVAWGLVVSSCGILAVWWVLAARYSKTNNPPTEDTYVINAKTADTRQRVSTYVRAVEE